MATFPEGIQDFVPRNTFENALTSLVVALAILCMRVLVRHGVDVVDGVEEPANEKHGDPCPGRGPA